MFVNSMATRRNRRRRTRKGGNWFTQKARDLGIYNGSSTSLLAREIYAMLGPNGIKPNRQDDFDNLMSVHPHVKKGKLLRDLRALGMTDRQEYEVVANLNVVLPSRIEKYESTTI
jgi:arginine/lysine/ornithine decarboxylase